jgi:hypothetical protein
MGSGGGTSSHSLHDEGWAWAERRNDDVGGGEEG